MGETASKPTNWTSIVLEKNRDKQVYMLDGVTNGGRPTGAIRGQAAK